MRLRREQNPLTSSLSAARIQNQQNVNAADSGLTVAMLPFD
jgi:hypothetical protein